LVRACATSFAVAGKTKIPRFARDDSVCERDDGVLQTGDSVCEGDDGAC